ncbi:MAG: YraN family protein [Bacteroidales bacterium]|jgi:putative endonuclease|nr:YraN family protein [Bacteroidales bacterium]MBR5670495.1 YraN family protein [Bacteroidales bacterium]
MKRNEIGRAGEEAALKYLQDMGMTLLARNWRSEHYELDIIMEYGDSIRIVEVKSLDERDDFDPTLNITPAKCRKLIAAAHRYIAENPTTKEIFFDVVTVLFGSATTITYIPSAFYPIYR